MQSNNHSESVTEKASTEVLQIDVATALRQKLPQYYRYIPSWAVNWLRKTICQDELNDILLRYGDKKGVDFAKAMIDDLDIHTEIIGIENIPTDTSRLIFASNHPLGALDGITLIALLGNRYPGKFKFLVNDLLLLIEPLRDIFLPINKHGSQSRNAAKAINEVMERDFAIATFPAGLCSRNIYGNHIEDLTWQKGFISKSCEFHRNIIPIHFEGRNSTFFYRLARIRKALGIKFNIEMLYLPSEIFKSRGKHFTIRIGKPISWQTFDKSRTPLEWADYVKQQVYQLHQL